MPHSTLHWHCLLLTKYMNFTCGLNLYHSFLILATKNWKKNQFMNLSKCSTIIENSLCILWFLYFSFFLAEWIIHSIERMHIGFWDLISPQNFDQNIKSTTRHWIKHSKWWGVKNQRSYHFFINKIPYYWLVTNFSDKTCFCNEFYMQSFVFIYMFYPQSSMTLWFL